MAYPPVNSCYVLSWEVASPAVRQNLIERIKRYENYCPIGQHTWAVLTTATAVQIRDYLIEVLGPQDRIFVVRSGTEAAWWNAYDEKNNDWLRTNL